MPRVPAGTTQRRSRAEMRARLDSLPRSRCSCGHVAVLASDYYDTSNVDGRQCVECYRAQERERQAGYRGAGGRLTVNLNRAGHRRPGAKGKIAQGALARKRSGRPRQAQKLGYVYCIGEQDRSAAVKIGYAQNAEFRIGALQTGNPRKLVILGVIRGTQADERDLHARYQNDNILNEWFRPSPELLSEFEIDMEMIA